VCHALALAGLAVAIVTDNAVIARVGSAVGLVGAIAFAWFTADVIWRMLPGKQS
jgi:succinate-acetate transporter protein